MLRFTLAIASLFLATLVWANDGIREAPKVQPASHAGIGHMVPDVSFTTIDGKAGKLSDYKEKKALVVAFTSTKCPLCLKYAASWGRIEKELATRDVAVLFVNPDQASSRDEMTKAVQAHGLQGAYVGDDQCTVTKALQPRTTTEVLLLDPARTIVYRGAVDDQYGLGYALDAPRQRYLLDAVGTYLANKPLVVAATSAPGCPIDYENAKAAKTDVTYFNQISRIVQQNCVECHRDGGVGPFALQTYEQVVAQAAPIRRVVDKGIMPPWFAANHGKDHDLWSNDRSLSAADKETLLTWLKSDQAKGNPADAPLARTYPDEGWLIGKPDAVFQIPKPFKVKADGVMPYQNATVETSFDEDKWIQALEVKPTARQVVHHVLVFAFPPVTNALDRIASEVTDERSGYFAIYVPGNSTLIYPEGFAKKLPKGSRLRFQIHYTPNGTATEDQTKLGVLFAKGPPRHEVKVAGIADSRLNIPPGAANHEESTVLKVPTDVRVLGYLPHMHVRGKAFRYDLTSPDGKTTTLLDVPRYDFNWQLAYRYAEPLLVKKGSQIKVTGWFDNSSDNPANPDPKARVRWGLQTYDEMLLGYVEYYVEGEGDDAEMSNPVALLLDAPRLMKRLDADNDGKISRDEFKGVLEIIPQVQENPNALQFLFTTLDGDKDGSLTVEELKKVRQFFGRN